MLNCKEVTELCSQELERPLRMGERVSMHTHLMMCSGCAKAYAEGGAATAAPQSDRED